MKTRFVFLIAVVLTGVAELSAETRSQAISKEIDEMKETTDKLVRLVLDVNDGSLRGRMVDELDELHSIADRMREIVKEEGGLHEPVGGKDIENLTKSLEKILLHELKLSVVGNFIESKWITVSQAEQIIEHFSSNEEKADVIVLVYPHIVDLHNAYRLIIIIEEIIEDLPDPVSESELQLFLKSLERILVVELRMQKVKDYSQSNWFMVSQVERILDFFPEDTSKKNVIITVYPRIIDLENTYNLILIIPEERNTTPEPLEAKDLDEFLQSLGNVSFSDDKMDMITQFSKFSWFTIDQVGKIVENFHFGEDKLDAIIVLYPRVVDKENTYKLYEFLTFSSDRAELKEKLAELEE